MINLPHMGLKVDSLQLTACDLSSNNAVEIISYVHFSIRV